MSEIAPTANYYHTVQKTWGWEEWIENNEKYCFKFLYVRAGCSGSLHYHKLKDETFYVQSGFCDLELGLPDAPPDAPYKTYTRRMNAGDTQRITPNQIHRFSVPANAATSCIIIEVSTHHDDADTFRLEASKPKVETKPDAPFEPAGYIYPMPYFPTNLWMAGILSRGMTATANACGTMSGFAVPLTDKLRARYYTEVLPKSKSHRPESRKWYDSWFIRGLKSLFTA